MVMVVNISGCQPNPKPLPSPRNFTARNLLIDRSLLGEEWKVNSKPTEFPPNVFVFRKNRGVATVSFSMSKASVRHIIATFSNSNDAARAYQDHDYTRDSLGRFPETWHELSRWTYESPVADQFRIVCADVENVTQVGSLCVIEAQYEEFLSIVIYGNDAPGRTVSDLIMVANAVDKRMAEFLGK
jgi:hypothetical protein